MGRKTKYSTNLFNNDLEGLSYFIGFLYSDGCVDIKNKSLRITSTDKDIIYKLKDRLQYTGPIYIYPPKDYGKLYNYVLKLHGEIYEYIRSLGVQFLKDNHSLSNLKIDLDFYVFCRGFLDGDGHYQLRKNKDNKSTLHYINFLGRHTLLKEIQDRLGYGNLRIRNFVKNPTFKQTKQLYNLNIYTKNAYDLANKIYKNATIYMDRKYNTWLECVPLWYRSRSIDYGIFQVKNRKKCWLVDILRNGIRYRKSFYTKEEALTWRDSLNL